MTSLEWVRKALHLVRNGINDPKFHLHYVIQIVINSFLMCINFDLVQERSVATDEFGKKAEDTETQIKYASEVKIPDIVPEPPRIRTSGSNNDLHHIESMDGGASNNSTPQPNDSMKQSDSSLQVDQTSVGKCIGNFLMQTNNI